MWGRASYRFSCASHILSNTDCRPCKGKDLPRPFTNYDISENGGDEKVDGWIVSDRPKMHHSQINRLMGLQKLPIEKTEM